MISRFVRLSIADTAEGMGESRGEDPISGSRGGRVWEAQIDNTDAPHPFFASFNLNDRQVNLQLTWKQLGLIGSHAARHMDRASRQFCRRV